MNQTLFNPAAMRLINGRAAVPRTVKPVARFPQAIATDADLLFGGNRVQTTLAVQIGANDTTITVADPTVLVPDMVVSLGKEGEICKITGPANGQTFPVIRGFDSTTPVAHLAGAVVFGNIVAWHHNALASEIEAIEQTLGVNLGRVPAGIFIISEPYNFPAQSPGASLTAGVNEITLSPVPFGVNGTDLNHYLYISGGSGAPEAVRIMGGSAVSGASAGTLFIQCANAHSGAWTIASATAGIYEAILANGGGTNLTVWIPHGTHQVFGPMEIGGMDGLTIRGLGLGSTVIDIAHPTNDLFVISSALWNLHLADFTVTSSVTRTGGWVVHGNVAPSASAFLRCSLFSGLNVIKQMNGFWIAQFEVCEIAMCWLSAFVGAGIAIKAGQTTSAWNINQGSGLYISETQIYGIEFGSGWNGTLAYALWIEDVDAMMVNRCDIGYCTVTNVLIFGNGRTTDNHSFNQLVCDTSGTGPVLHVTGRGSTVLLFDGCWFANGGQATWTTTSPNVLIDCPVDAGAIRNCIFGGALGNALRIDSPTHEQTVVIAGNIFLLNGMGSTADTIYINTPWNSPAPILLGNYDMGNMGAGKSLATSPTSNLVRLGDNVFQSGTNFGTPPAGQELTAITGPLGGLPMTAGQSVSTVTTVPGAVFGMTVLTTPQGPLNPGFTWQSYVSGPNTVVTVLTCITTGTPNDSLYMLRLKY